jgi:hypothetical protein
LTICVAVKKDEVVSPTAHRSGAAPIAIADPVAAPIAEDADHNGALSPRLTRGLHHSESRDGAAVVYLLRSTEYQFCNCGVL